MDNQEKKTKKIDYEYEKKFLDDYMNSLRFFEPFLFKKMYRTGALASKIGQTFGVEDNEYYLAGFYANIGLQAMDNLLTKTFLDEREKEQIKRHPVLASEFLKYKGLEKCAELVYYHHELPDGSGYYGFDNYPIEACYINIADTFEGSITPKSYRPALTLKEALDVTLKPYKNGLKIPLEQVKEIEKILINFYNETILGV